MTTKVINLPPVEADEGEVGAVTVFGASMQRIEPSFDADVDQWLYAVEASGTLDFWEHEDEDCYTLEDGDPQ